MIKAIRQKMKKKGWGENKKNSEALFKNSHFSFSVNIEIHDDFICAVPLREKGAVRGASPRARWSRTG